jgi:hypothetical protein
VIYFLFGGSDMSLKDEIESILEELKMVDCLGADHDNCNLAAQIAIILKLDRACEMLVKVSGNLFSILNAPGKKNTLFQGKDPEDENIKI